MATYTATVGQGGGTYVYLQGPHNLGITIPSDETPTSVTLQLLNDAYFFLNSGSSSDTTTYNYTLYLLDTDGTNEKSLYTIAIKSMNSNTALRTAQSFTISNGAGLAGKALALRSEGTHDPSWIAVRGILQITVTTSKQISNCSPPTSVTIEKASTVHNLKVTWSGASGGTNNAISSFRVVLNTSKTTTSNASAKSVTTTATSGSTTLVTPSRTAYYAGVQTRGAAGSSYYSTWKWSSSSIMADWPENCGPPSSVTVTRVTKNTLKITWGAGTAGTDNAISNYRIICNTTATTSGATAVSTNALPSSASTGINNSPSANATYYYGVRTQGAAGSSYYSGYTWSSAITIPAQPSVTQGNKINKTDMDDLKTWLNGSQTTVSQGEQITETIGDTYGASTQGDKVTAAWYNNLT